MVEKTSDAQLAREIEISLPVELNSEKIAEDITATTPVEDAPALVKKIGRTTYINGIYFLPVT